MAGRELEIIITGDHGRDAFLGAQASCLHSEERYAGTAHTFSP